LNVELTSSERNLKVGELSAERFLGRFLIVVLGSPPTPTPGAQGVSVIGAALLRGSGVVTEKSAALLLVSSGASSRVGQPRAIVRLIAWPVNGNAAAGPVGDGGVTPAAGPVPTLTQSMFSQQINPPPLVWMVESALLVASRPPAVSSPIMIVAWSCPLATPAENVVAVGVRLVWSQTLRVWPATWFCPAAYICSST